MNDDKQFHTALLMAVAECKKIGYNPSYFLQMIDDRGPVETARHLITSPHPSDGFTTLWEKRRLDLSVEAIALRPEFANLFARQELDDARDRLADYGYTPANP